MLKPLLYYYHIIQQLSLRMFKKIRIAVQLIILSNNHVLLIKHSYTNKYYFPGGGVKKKESLSDALKREILEELGVKINQPQLYRITEYYQNSRQDYIFLFKTTELSQKSKIEIDKFEITNYRWFSLSNINKHKSILSPATYRLLTKYKPKSKIKIQQW